MNDRDDFFATVPHDVDDCAKCQRARAMLESTGGFPRTRRPASLLRGWSPWLLALITVAVWYATDVSFGPLFVGMVIAYVLGLVDAE